MSDAPVNPSVAPDTSVEAPQPDGQDLTPAEAKRYKFKVDNEDVDLDEASVVAELKRARNAKEIEKGSRQKFEEAAKVRKQAEQFLNQLRTDPRSVLTNPKLGIDFRKIAEEYLAEHYETELLSPEEVAARKEKAELKKYRDSESEQKRKAEAEQEDQVKAAMRGDYEKQIIGALEGVQVPRTPDTVKRMVAYAAKNIELGYEVPMSQIAELVRDDYVNDVKSLLGPLDGDLILQLLGDDVGNKIRKSDIKRLRPQNTQAPRQASVQQPRSTEPPKQLDGADFLRRMREQRSR